jgi:hypothetical protein
LPATLTQARQGSGASEPGSWMVTEILPVSTAKAGRQANTVPRKTIEVNLCLSFLFCIIPLYLMLFFVTNKLACDKLNRTGAELKEII